MFFKANTVIEIGDGEVTLHSFKKKLFKESYYSSLHAINENSSLPVNKNKRSIILLNGQQIEIKPLYFPKCNKHSLKDMISNELNYYFDEPMDICFSYIINGKDKNNINVLLYSLNYRNNSIIEKVYGKKIKGIYVIQFCIFNYYKRKIKSKNYIFACKYKGYLYLMCCIEGVIVDSLTEKIEFNLAKFNDGIIDFIRQNSNNHNNIINDIYCSNYSLFKEGEKLPENYNLIELECFRDEDIHTIINMSRSYKNEEY